MLELRESCHVPRSTAEVSRYLADFSTAAEWDPTTVSAKRLDSGPIAEGARFELVCKLPLGTTRVRYTLTGLKHGEQLTLSGESAFFTVDDDIQLTATDGGCRIDYRASFQFPAFIERLVQKDPAGLEAMGRRTIESLATALRDDNPSPEAQEDTRRADRWLLPGVAHFTRAGYRRGRRRWPASTTDISGRHIVLTGATSGLGMAAASTLADAGAHLTLVARNRDRGESTVAELQSRSGNRDIVLECADLGLLQDTDDLAARLREQGRPVDVLINNAGALFNQRGETAEGLEQSFALLLLSPWRLGLGLLPLLRQSHGGRVINVVSGGMYTQKLDLDILAGQTDDYNGSVAYAQAKRALMIVTEHWAEAWSDDGISVNAMHPGWADTPGVESALPLFHKLVGPFLRSPEEGADTIVWLSRAREAGLVSGQLFLDREPRPTHLLHRTRESAADREALLALLEQYRPDSKG
ncbi:SDR family NAD(P)-dependent oxidoreductase [Parahaliea maris]|uniref:SDR family NAD(P)-dependent oxidoreductase n=1 Tax=Parahaliea maris TaxID=2716870 RepID=A0A5C8ZZK7_9GAMM|nr:SDR family NAD(P)-dependent oxidoreductase [Parahaliea maris]TXS92827.1 SDR family NAD(P)-dependent oxidoreductase [Parahaliea maris]